MKYKYSGCIGLTSIALPDSLEKIETLAFEGCKNLTELAIPQSVTTIENDAFDGCTGLNRIIVAEGNTKYVSCYGNPTQ